MSEKESLKSNAITPTLFIGVGGIGGRTIKGVANLCKNDDKENVRFVILDTDTNDLSRAEDEAQIIAIQTSSTRNIKDYLEFDKDAKNNWFPNNRILDSKTVSEGAGQVRAISRLALNASIRQNKIKALYNAIDDLYLKDGKDYQRAIKVIISTTATGGTGSGIAMIVAMLIRDYIEKNYPESSAIIRGFFIMPGVMRTVIKSEKEMDSQERNGYSTIKEINAFMMDGSGFFESNDDLKRYKGLKVTVPTTDGGIRDLKNLPFDFCFLIERNDSNQKIMVSLSQYEKFVSQCIYDQTISILSKKASSQEDNVIKTFIDPELLGRSRFGSVGASVLRYPYEKIRDYIAYTWAEKNILGVRNLKGVSNEDLVKASWLAYDNEYWQRVKEYENGELKEMPDRGDVYIESINNSTTDFSEEIKEKQIGEKYKKYVEKDNQVVSESLKNRVEKIADEYIVRLTRGLTKKYVDDSNLAESYSDANNASAGRGELEAKYLAIADLHENNQMTDVLESLSKDFIATVFEARNPFKIDVTDETKIENYVSADGRNALHPNAIRCLLYALRNKMRSGSDAIAANDSYIMKFDERVSGKENEKAFQVHVNPGKETTLLAMCKAVDGIDEDSKIAAITDKNAVETAQKLLKGLNNLVMSRMNEIATNNVCRIGLPFINEMIDAFEKFYDSFERKITSIDKVKKDIVSSIEFHNGDCVKNLFASKDLLEMIAESCGGSDRNSQMFADIYEAIKENSIIAKKKAGNPLLMESTKDIFNEVIIENYKKDVETNCDSVINLDILHAMKYQYEITQLLKARNETNDDAKENIIKAANNKRNRNDYIMKLLKELNILAAPSLSKNNDKEDREVSAMAYGAGVDDDDSVIRIEDFSKYLDKENKSPAISKYELHCFRSTYGLTPEDITPLKYVKPERHGIRYSDESGEYFKKYQAYMEEIGPDSRVNPIITTHIDRRWNSIAAMPEMDLNYQRMLMGHIHEAYFYGFIFGAIKLAPQSSVEPDNLVYVFNNDGRKNRLYVADGTNCSELYKVVDALYLDRKLVKSIHDIAEANRAKTEAKPVSFDQTEFAKKVAELKRSEIVNYGNDETKKKADDSIPMSIFELPALYYDSLPPRKKDAAELKTMIQGIMYALLVQIRTVHEENDAKAIWKRKNIEHYKLLLENHKKVDCLKSVPEDVINSFKDYIASYLGKQGVDYKKDFEKNNI